MKLNKFMAYSDICISQTYLRVYNESGELGERIEYFKNRKAYRDYYVDRFYIDVEPNKSNDEIRVYPIIIVCIYKGEE